MWRWLRRVLYSIEYGSVEGLKLANLSGPEFRAEIERLELDRRLEALPFPATFAAYPLLRISNRDSWAREISRKNRLAAQASELEKFMSAQQIDPDGETIVAQTAREARKGAHRGAVWFQALKREISAAEEDFSLTLVDRLRQESGPDLSIEEMLAALDTWVSREARPMDLLTTAHLRRELAERIHFAKAASAVLRREELSPS